MTVSSNNRCTPVYACDGSTKSYAYDYKIDEEGHIQVVVLEDGVEEVQTLNVDYTLTGVGDAAGGTFVFVIAPAAGAETLARAIAPNVQLFAPVGSYSGVTNITNAASAAAVSQSMSSIATALDRLSMQIQQLEEKNERSAKHSLFTDHRGAPLQIADIAAADVGKVLGITDDSPPMAAPVAIATPGALTVTSFIETLLDDSTAGAARTTLDVPANSALTGLGKPIMLDECVTVLGSSSLQDNTFRTIDLTASTSAAARFAILRVEVSTTSSGTAGRLIIRLRKNGITPTAPIRIVFGILVTNTHVNFGNSLVIVPLDAGQSFQWAAEDDTGTAATSLTSMFVEGYIE